MNSHAYPMNTTLDLALDAFNRAATGDDIIRIQISEQLFANSHKPFIKGDIVVAQKVSKINPLLKTRFYLISKATKKPLFFANITELEDSYSIIAEHTDEAVNVSKCAFFEAVEVYEVLFYQRYI